jgi:predicted ATPase/DNA-binding SARP family transcriptional activator/DNA-binding CsgD family transcriptional regulator/Tfp pilus assembly protein PilF
MSPPDGYDGMTRPETVRVWLLGSFKVSVGSRTVKGDAWRLKKAAALVKLLALAPGHRLHREQAMEALWPDLGPEAAANNLRVALHAARRVLDPDPAVASRCLASRGEQLALRPEGHLWVDVEAFEEATAAARRAREPAAHRAAIALYTGELLPEDRYEEWAEEKREELRATYVSLLGELAALYEERGEFGPAIETLRRAVTVEPTDEEAHVGLMRLYAVSDRQREALAQYERLREVLSGKLGTEPNAATQRLRDEIAAGGFPTTRTPPTSSLQDERSAVDKHNLPAPRTSFVGREREMLEVKRELAMTRLLTLTGAGGSGKTRLALEVARSLVGAYPDGVWLVELAGLSQEILVPQAVAGVLEVPEQPDRTLTEALVESLRGQEILLILDNCEHLVYAAAGLVDVLLDACPRLWTLATSREALDVAGEVRWSVPALSVPDPGRPLSVGGLEGYESTRLFAERAQRRNPAFDLTPQNTQAVAEICRRLEGIPLAIELAAARVGALSVEQIAERLSDSLELLTGGGRMTPPKQQTLRGTMDWSYQLLAELEQTLFRRLSVFTGGWTLGAAEAVGAGDGIDEGDVLELLSRLVEKSLIVIQAIGDGELRYGMLEPVRQYAREKLVEMSGKAEATRRRHATFFLELAEEAEPRVQELGAATSLGRLESEHDNIRATLSWSLESGEAELGLRLGAALLWFWSARGYWSEGARWLEEALARDGAAEPATRAGALSSLGVVLGRQSDFEQAEACHEEALALYEELGDQGRVAESLAHLAWMAEFRGDAARATTLFEKSLAAARVSGNSRPIPSALNGLAYIAFESEAFERAQGLWGKALALNREQGNVLEVATVLNSMGYTELARGNQERATALLEESLPLNRELENKHGVAHCLMALGIAATLQGEPERAKALLKEGLAIDVELGSKADIAETLEGLAAATGALGEHVRAARLWGVARALRETIDVPWWSAERLLHEPQLVAARSRMDEARWETALAEGRNMRLEEAVEYALSEEGPATALTTVAEQSSAEEPPPTLTRREREVANLLEKRFTSRQIASELHLSERTVDKHVANILRKLNLHSREQVAVQIAKQRSYPF